MSWQTPFIGSSLQFLRTIFSRLNWLFFLVGFVWDIFSFSSRIGDLSFVLLLLQWFSFEICFWLHPLVGEKVQSWLKRISYFSMGSLFSALSVLYFRSSHYTLGAVGALLLGVALIWNETRWSKTKRIELIMVVQGLLSSLLLAFLLPHWGGEPSLKWTWTSVGFGSVLGLLGWCWYAIWGQIHWRNLPPQILFPILLATWVSWGYFPPLPLVLQDSFFAQDHTGSFSGHCPAAHSWNYAFVPSVMNYKPGQKVYFYTSIYSPKGMKTILLEKWWYFSQGEWHLVDQISHSIQGGRERGFRLWGAYTHPKLGLWKLELTVPGYGALMQKQLQLVADNTPLLPCRLQ